MKARKPTALVSAIALLGGCTTTLAVRHDSGHDLSAGIPAVLPFTRYEIGVTWRLADCSQTPKIVIAVEGSAGSEDDPAQSYLIDADSLQGPLNTSQLNVTYHDNSSTLKTVNAEVVDHSAAVIANVVRTAVALAPAIAGFPSVALTGTRSPDSRGPQPPLVCSPGMVAALNLVRDLKRDLETMNGQVAAATQQMATLAAAATRMNGAIDPVTSQRYGDSIDNLERLIAAHAALADQLADALKPLTFKRTIRWPDNGTELVRTIPATIDQSVLDRWFGAGSSTPAQWPQAFFAIERVVPRQASPVAGDELPRAGSSGRARNPRSGTRVTGIPYRVLVRGRLVTCPSLCRLAGEGSTVVEGPVAQLGTVHVLPVRNPPFGSISFAAEFRRDGTLVSAGYAQQTAPLESATGALAGAAEALGPLADPTARLTRETAYLQALQQRRAAAEALQTVPTNASAEAREALEAETTLVNAQIANLQARITLQELQARSGTR